MTIDELRALLAKATPGPWLPFDADVKWDTPLLTGYDRRENHATPPCYATGPRVRTEDEAAADNRLIVAAVNALPALLDLWGSMLWHNDETCVEDSADNCRICCALAKLGSK